MFNKAGAMSRIDAAVAESVNFELTVADISRRSERRAWWVAGSAVTERLKR